MTRLTIYILLIASLSISYSCESEAERNARKDREEKERIEREEYLKKKEEERLLQLEQERIERERLEEARRKEEEARLEKERREKAIYDKYIDNSLSTGAIPYAYCYGRNRSCSNNGCSQIKVRTPSDSDVLVSIKKNGSVYRHAYIEAGDSYTFEFPNGTYQTFFYYGKGWNPNEVLKETDCGPLKGRFISDEHFGKDDPQILNNNILEYELILQRNGNFSTRPSNPDEAF